MSDDVIIRVDGLWKRYGLPLPETYYKGRRWLRSLRDGHNPSTALRTGLQSAICNLQSDDGPWALRDVSFEVKRGETLGIIGRNGAGKSTLLKVLAGVTPPTRGKVEVRGRVFPMIELNAGLHMELTGRENVYLLGAVMGMSRAEVNARMPAIEEFCELREWFDRPVRMYSSGMLARLGFGVAFHVDADILLIDEILAVGDMAFRQKCVEWLNVRLHKNVTVLLVSHRTYQIERLCQNAIYLSRGELIFSGNAKEACGRYYATLDGAILSRLRRNSGVNTEAHDASHDIRIAGVKLLDSFGNEVKSIVRFSDLRVQLELQVCQRVAAPHFSVVIVDTDMNPVAHATTLGKVDGRPIFEPGVSYVECVLHSLPLVSGVYLLDAAITDKLAIYRIDYVTGMAKFQILAAADEYSMPGGGYLSLAGSWKLPEQDGGTSMEDDVFLFEASDES